VTSKVLADATDVVKGMIDQGAGALIVDLILPEVLGLEIEFEFEAADA
jgi:FixJ family two-component response regulator